jgi:hypothetical protein
MFRAEFGRSTYSRNHTTYVESACAHQGLWSGTAYVGSVLAAEE